MTRVLSLCPKGRVIMKLRDLVLTVLAVLLIGCDKDVPESKSTPEATVYTASTILTMNTQSPIAQAIAVADGKIIAVGTVDDILAEMTDFQLSIDDRFQDKVIMPGFVENHLHPTLAGVLLPSVFITPWDWDLPHQKVEGVQGKEAYLNQLAQKVAQHNPSDGFFITWGYQQYFHGEIGRVDLDAINSEIPIIVWQRSFHEVIANSAALKQLNMTADDYAQHPMIDFARGHFWERGLFSIMARLQPIIQDPDRLQYGMYQGLDHARRNGITAVADQGVPMLNLDREMAMLESVIKEHNLPLHMFLVGNAKGMAPDGDEVAAVQAISALPERDTDTLTFLPKQVKLLADGAFYSQLMQMQDGYLDGHHGEWLTPPEDLLRIARRYWLEDFQIHIHVNGDEGVRVVLDMIDTLNVEYPRPDHRTVLHHFGYSAPDQIKRLADLGAWVSANPFYIWALGDKYAEVGLGPERAHAMVRLGALERHGVPISLHSDLPMAPAAPLTLASVAASRQSALGNILMPSEKLSPEAALRSITIDAARMIQQNDSIGSIEVGKSADFAVLEANPLTMDPVLWRDIHIWGTVFKGKVRPAD